MIRPPAGSEYVPIPLLLPLVKPGFELASHGVNHNVLPLFPIAGPFSFTRLLLLLPLPIRLHVSTELTRSTHKTSIVEVSTGSLPAGRSQTPQLQLGDRKEPANTCLGLAFRFAVFFPSSCLQMTT